MTRPVSLRRSLIRNLLAVMLPLSILLVAATFLGGRKAGEFLSRSLISQTIAQTEAQLHRFFDPVVNLLEVMRDWGDAGLLDVDDPEPLRHLLPPLLASHGQVSSALVADVRGHEVMILQVQGGWRSRQTRVDEWGRRTRWVEWSGQTPEPVSYWRELDYDPRRRPWYQGAIEKLRELRAVEADPRADGLIHWTRPYTFFTTKEPGITASVVFPAPSGIESVVGFDVLLRDISAFTSSLKVGDHGGVMVLTDEGRVVGLPGYARFGEIDARRAALLKRLDELNWPLAEDADRAFGSQAEGESAPVRFTSGDMPWWGQRTPFQLAPDRRLWITVIVPEYDLLGDLRRMPLGIMAVTLLIVAVASWRALAVARRFSAPIEALVRQSDRIRRGDLDDPEPVVSSVKEVRRLARAHERMRTGLKSLMKLERDLQLARQIQEATLPARLPSLQGFEIDAWSEPAEETGGDTFDIIGLRGGGGVPLILTGEDADRAVLLLADATGHGIGPALSATEVRAMLRMAVRTGESLEQMARHINHQLCADLRGGRFITAWLAELDGPARSLSSFSAGQAPILHYEAPADTVHVLEADAPPLGILADLEVSLGRPIHMQPGDIVAVISDGVLEAMDPEGRQFGLDRAVAALLSSRTASAGQALAGLRHALAEFTAGRAAGDDRTAILIKRV
jgi:serine phosphatase RsbU (regulator of sigma subunit)